MLVIRREQYRVFEADLEQEIDEEVARRLGARYPVVHALLGDEEISSTVAVGGRRARAHGLRSTAAIGLYVGLMLQLGSDFDRDPQLPWAEAILRDEAIPGPGARLELMCRMAVTVIERIKGRRDEHLLAALGRLQRDPLGRPVTQRPPVLSEGAAAVLRRIYPEKVELLLEQGTFERLLADGRAAAHHHRGTDPWSETLFAGLALMLGSGFLDDPQLPWVQQALSAGEDAGPPCVRLHRAAMSHLQRVMMLTDAGGH